MLHLVSRPPGNGWGADNEGKFVSDGSCLLSLRTEEGWFVSVGLLADSVRRSEDLGDEIWCRRQDLG